MSGICDSPKYPTRKMSLREIELTAEIRRVTNGPTIQNKLSFGRAEALEHLNTLYEELHELQTDAMPAATNATRLIPVAGLDEAAAERAAMLRKTVKIAPGSNNYFAPLPRMKY